MTDRELLELAAKAAGMEFEWNACSGAIEYIPDGCQGYIKWLPLHDDGDALRLAVKLRLELYIHEDDTRAIDGNLRKAREDHGSDPYAATRRAIVRAAAEIGKAQAVERSQGAGE